ncbi:hypothetical protein ABZU32_38580 [Sphaerisporangium sp. NPDC005288]|uniref:hypothetical protein n=1 Tax=Sphaerisporangium sp. NPDC005288 TaxID=3155114 RepID=UPI00339EB639
MRKSTTAISAGALTLALASGTALLVAAPAAGSATGAHGCERGGAALSGLTGGVCDLLDQVGVPGAGAGKPVTGAESGTGTATGTATGTGTGKATGTASGTGTEPGTGTGSGTGTGTGARSETGSGLSDREREPEEGAAGPPRDGLKPLTDAVSDLTGDALKPVTDTVSDLGGDGLKPLTDQVEKTADKLTGRGHRSSPTAAPASPDTPDTPDAEPSPSPGEARDGSGDDDLLGVPIDTDCLPLVGSADCGEEGGPSTSKPPTGTDADRSTPSAAPSATPRGGDDDGDDHGGDHGGGGGKDRSPGEPPAGQQGPPQIVDRPGPPVDRATPAARASHPPSADVESPPLVPLWPGLPLPSLLGDPRARTAVPERPYDVVGTALTAVLLASAILAARIVQSRRDSDAPRSMPFEGMSHPDNGRHRLA